MARCRAGCGLNNLWFFFIRLAIEKQPHTHTQRDGAFPSSFPSPFSPRLSRAHLRLGAFCPRDKWARVTMLAKLNFPTSHLLLLYLGSPWRKDCLRSGENFEGFWVCECVCVRGCQNGSSSVGEPNRKCWMLKRRSYIPLGTRGQLPVGGEVCVCSGRWGSEIKQSSRCPKVNNTREHIHTQRAC